MFAFYEYTIFFLFCVATRLETTVEIHGSPTNRQSSPDRELKSPTSIEDEDFVAYQRELSRSLLSGAYSEEELVGQY